MRSLPSSALAALLLLCACSGGSGAADEAGTSAAGTSAAGTSAAGSPASAGTATTTQLSCTPGAVFATGAGSLLNNHWNAASAGAGPWQQCLVSRPAAAAGVTEYGWSWKWPTRDGLYAYPEILVGGSPWSDTPSNDSRFPRSIAETAHLQVSYEIESQADGKGNLALEFWLSDPKAPALASGRPPVKAELMIWSDESDGLIPAGDAPVGSVAIDGITWAVYLHRDWGDASGAAGQRWAYIAYHADRLARSRSAHYDARKFFDDAIARGVITADDRIAGVELGNELVSGSGVSWIRNFSLGLP